MLPNEVHILIMTGRQVKDSPLTPTAPLSPSCPGGPRSPLGPGGPSKPTGPPAPMSPLLPKTKNHIQFSSENTKIGHLVSSSTVSLSSQFFWPNLLTNCQTCIKCVYMHTNKMIIIMYVLGFFMTL